MRVAVQTDVEVAAKLQFAVMAEGLDMAIDRSKLRFAGVPRAVECHSVLGVCQQDEEDSPEAAACPDA